MSDRKLTFIEHLEELRWRIIKSIGFLIMASIVIYVFREQILSFLVKPIGTVVFISPAEAFLVSIKIALLGGLYFTSPFIIYQVWHFLSGGVGRDEKRHVIFYGIFSFVFFISGSLFGYFIIVPIGMKFLLSFRTDFLTPMISISRYVGFIGILVLTFGIVFQLPIIAHFLTKTGIITPGFLSQNRKYAIVLIFIAAAILTPPDVITQCLLAIPLLVLYEFSIVISRMIK